jgi:preprotein translocase subunit YajC
MRHIIALALVVACSHFLGAEEPASNAGAAQAPAAQVAPKAEVSGDVQTSTPGPKKDAGLDSKTSAETHQGASAPAGQGSQTMIMMLVIVGVFGLMIFMQFRAQKKEKKAREAMMGGLKVGDRVLTIGGIFGKIVRRGEQDVDLQVSDSPVCVITVTLSALSGPAEKPQA